jgi:biotin-dependent carboxylase-like uncharacterized protein
MTATARAATVTVVDPGWSTTVQDAGRHGLAHLGVSGSGAADRSSHARANRAVGNPSSAGALESVMGGVAVRLDADRWCALAGAPAEVTVDGRIVGDPLLFRVRAGQLVRVGVPIIGLRTYLAIGGGVVGRSVLGSASYDSLAGLGTPPATAGTRWALGEPAAPAAPGPSVAAMPQGVSVVPAVWGPRDDLLDPADRDLLGRTTWTVSGSSDRVGLRLTGDRLRLDAGSLPSEGSVAGAVEIPPSGEPIVFLADHPVTAGYPVVAVVLPGALDLLGQCRPGDRLVLAVR